MLSFNIFLFLILFSMICNFTSFKLLNLGNVGNNIKRCPLDPKKCMHKYSLICFYHKNSHTYMNRSIYKYYSIERSNEMSSSFENINDALVKQKIYTFKSDPTLHRYPSKKFNFVASDLPDETIYLIDGTAMLFLSHYSREHNLEYKNTLLSETLANNIVSKLNQDQIQKLMDLNNVLDPSFSNDTIEIVSSVVEDKNVLALKCGALITMIISFARIIRDVKPKYVAVAFDAGRTTFRNELFPSYKQQRKETPPDLLILLPICIQVLDILGFKCLMQNGFEADDVMASLSKWSKERGLNVVHLSPDKDMLQLIDYGVHIMLPKGKEMVGVQNVIEKFGIPPQSLCDYQALMGDAVDNIPGARGIGPKIASILVKYFNTVENMYEQLGLIGLPKATDELLGLSPASKELSNHLLSIMTKPVMDHALNELEKCLKSASAKPITTLARLYLCGYDNILLYKQLVTLKSDISVEELYHSSLYRNGSTTVELVNKIQLTTEQFRYKGEDRMIYSSIEVDKILKSISPALMKPVKLLREQYHKLDR